jgi:hypothetical protein
MAISLPDLLAGKSSDPAISFSISAKINYEYNKTKSGEIIGGATVITVTGIVSVTDPTTSGSYKVGAKVMQTLKEIRNLGRISECYDIDISGFNGRARIVNINIEQGPDPAWVNQGAFSIELRAQLPEIPSNSFGIVVTDHVQSINSSQSITFGEDAHGYVYSKDLGLSKAYVKFSNRVSVTLDWFCPEDLLTVESKLLGVLKKLMSVGPTHELLSVYKTWTPYLMQGRSFTIDSDNTASINLDMILMHPSAKAGGSSAFVDISFSKNNTYEVAGVSSTKTISGTINGLLATIWSDIITLNNTETHSKLIEAENVFSYIKNKFKDITSWDGISLDLVAQPNCPNTAVQTATPEQQGALTPQPFTPLPTGCYESSNNKKISQCIEPSSTKVARSRSEGTITFSFEWNNQSGAAGCIDQNGTTTDVTVDIAEPTVNLAEFKIPRGGVYVQNIQCASAQRFIFTATTTKKKPGCAKTLKCGTLAALDDSINNYINFNENEFLLIRWNETESNTSYVITKEYIKKCA